MSTLNITLVQADLAWHQPEQNRRHIQHLVCRSCGDTDMVVLPEMFTTGFTMQAEDFAETMQGPTVQWMNSLAQELDAAVCGSVIISENGRFFNRFVFAMPGGDVASYDKRHLFAMAGEHRSYSAGERREIVTFRGWRICPMICYDLRFPSWSRNTDDFDLLVYVANWPDRRREHWQVLCRARAIENQCYVAAVNRVGTDGKGHDYSGDSALFDFAGEERWHSAGGEAVRTLILDRQAMAAYRERFPFLADRDRIGPQC